MKDYSWIAEIALETKSYSSSLGVYLAKALTLVSFEPVTDTEIKRAWAVLTRDLVHYGMDPDFELPPDLDATMEALQTMGIEKYNQDLVDETKIAPLLTDAFNKAFETLGEHPEILDLIDQADIVEDILTTVASRTIPFFQLFPVFSKEAQNLVPYLKEPLFTALYELPEIEQHKLTWLTEKILRRFYQYHVRPKLEDMLTDNIKGKNLLLPLIDQAVDHLPPDRCMTSLISILCTPREEISQGRIISIVLQELGGMYVKMAQVLAEMAPPILARELRHQQDNLGGIFGSQQKSWKYVQDIFQRPGWERLKHYLHIPKGPQNVYAGASVGAIYEFTLTELGKRKLRTHDTILIKIQRPHLASLFEAQKNTLLTILGQMDENLPQTELTESEQQEVRGFVTALKRSIINYAIQSEGELDFRIEKRNADRIREALKGEFDLQIPQYFHVERDVVMMEKMTGEKITSVVHSRYLERMSIADTVSDAYLYLIFQKGIIWADPHAGNILYDPENHQVKLIDLNPCFAWDNKTIKVFIGFLYRLILSDHKGVFESLKGLVENPVDLQNPKTEVLIKNFISSGIQGAFIHYLSDFIRLLGEANIDLKVEVQAAMRGITQVYLTSSAISSRHHFGQIFQKQFGWKMLIRHILSIGPVKVLRAILPLAFDLVKNTPEQEVGPTLDERDIWAIEESLVQLTTENVCNIELIRTSPDENTRLTMSTDGSSLIKSTNLRLEIQTETKPASVRYLLEIPSKEWLKDRQEYVKLQGMGLALCLVECLEQLRRHSLEDYWYVVESWSTPPFKRSWKEASLIGDVRLAARHLFARRYENIWTSEFMTVSRWNRLLWKTLIKVEERFDKRESGYFYLLSKKMGAETTGKYTFGTLHRIRIIVYRLIISWLKTLIRRSRFEMHLLPLTTDELIHRMLHGLLRRSGPEKLTNLP